MLSAIEFYIRIWSYGPSTPIGACYELEAVEAFRERPA
jgi:hypothetical protein